MVATAAPAVDRKALFGRRAAGCRRVLRNSWPSRTAQQLLLVAYHGRRAEFTCGGSRGLADAIEMGATQRAELMSYAAQYVNKFTAQAWAQSFVGSLEEVDSERLREQSLLRRRQPLPLTSLYDGAASEGRRATAE